MLRLTLAQMRRSIGRLTAAAIAVAIGSAFVAATLLAGNAMRRTTYDAVTSGFGGADVLVGDGAVTDATLAALEEVPGVAAVHGSVTTGVDLVGPGGRTWSQVTDLADEPALRPTVAAEGRMPTADDEVALPGPIADVLGAQVGDEVDASWWPMTGEGSDVGRTTGLEVVGLVTTEAAFLGSGGVAVVSADRLDGWLADTGEAGGYAYAAVLADAGVSPDELVRRAQAAVGDDLAVRTRDEQAALSTAELTGSTTALTAVVLGFAAVALLVAALVIANTFQVLVAQRTRTLALLRCVGAQKSWLRRSVVTEALLLGATSSAVGVLLGTGLVQAALTVLGRATDVPLPDVVAVTPWVVLVPLTVGTAVTVLAALAPARAATRVPPLAALRPDDAASVAERSGKLRLATTVVLVALGVAGLAAGLRAGETDPMVGLALGVGGGTASFVGVLVGAVFWVPRLVGLLGRLAGPGVASRLAAANSVRNPRRTASTSAALLIGVTLVVMMSTGAATTRTGLGRALAGQFPVDVAVSAPQLGVGVDQPVVPPSLAAELAALPGVTAVARLESAVVDVEVDGAVVSQGTQVLGAEADEASGALQEPAQLEPLDDATIVVPGDLAQYWGVTDGDTATLRATPATAAGETTEPAAGEREALMLTVAVTDLPGWEPVVTTASLEKMATDPPLTRLWLRVADLDDAEGVATAAAAAASDTGTALETTGAAVERAFYQRVVDTLLAVVVGLLGVAVVIALVGVANTLSLSVLERRRESATLRAIGLSTRQLRGTLAIEGLLVAGVGALAGLVLGTAYGWAGARTLLAGVADVQLTVPWSDLGLVVLVALVAGALASVLPARHAVRTPPVAALGVE